MDAEIRANVNGNSTNFNVKPIKQQGKPYKWFKNKDSQSVHVFIAISTLHECLHRCNLVQVYVIAIIVVNSEINQELMNRRATLQLMQRILFLDARLANC